MLSLSSDPPPGVKSHIEAATQGHCKTRKIAHARGESCRHVTTADVFPDNVLLEIFDFYRNEHSRVSRVQWWNSLVHVSRRWRQVIFESPRRLNLQIRCTHGTPVKKNLGIWPSFPIVIDYYRLKGGFRDGHDIIAALEHPDRVCFFKFQRRYEFGSELENIATAMQKPFPMLTYLDMSSRHEKPPVLPAEFLGGYAPCLQEIILSGIPYPSLPALLLSTSDLVKLDLFDIPPTGYISPEAMVASLAALPRLQNLVIGFELATSRPDMIHPPPVTRTVLPALTNFRFKGASEYLEDLVCRIDSPQLNQILITYLNQVVDFQVVQLSNFMDRTVGPEVTLFKHAQFTFSYDTVAFTTYPHTNHSAWDRRPATTIISCEGTDWQVSHIAQVLSHLSANLTNVAHLKLKVKPEGRELKDADDVQWLHLLRQFTAVRTLHVSRELARHVALALEDVTAEMIEVLPSLDSIRVVGQLASSIEKFTSSRLLSGFPVSVFDTETEFDKRLEAHVSDKDNSDLHTYSIP